MSTQPASVRVCRHSVVPIVLALAAVQAARADVATTAGSITVSGSTAFAGFFESPGSTNDFIDANSDGIYDYNPNGGSGPGDPAFVQQLAPAVNLSGNTLTGYQTSTNNSGVSQVGQWSVQYRGAGSVNGLSELVNYALTGAVPTTFVNPSSVNATVISSSRGGPAGFYANTPVTSVDAAVLDVAISWGVQGSAGTAKWNAKPTTAGYGMNAVLPQSATAQDNKLASLTVGSQSLNLNTALPDSKTVFSTGIAFAPISVVSNHGTGLQNVTQDELAFMYVTGRASDGSNYVMATRDIGSGTRNGAMNSLGVDPSFGTGDNLGDMTVPGSQQANLGAHFQPTNLDATGTMGNVVKNSRLAVGYVSTSTGKTNQASGAYETLGVKFAGGSDYVRPTAATIVENGTAAAFGTGYRIGGVETVGTVGDPNATPWANMTVGGYITTSNPAMANANAALYVRNIEESVKAFTASPNSSNNFFMPAQSLINVGIPLGASRYVQDVADPTHWIANGSFSQNAYDAEMGSAGNALNTGAYGSGLAPYGVVPTREAGSYLDGQTASYRYYDNSNTLQTVAAGQALNLRNAIAGDFNGDGLRNVDDAAELVSAASSTEAWAKAHNSGSAGAGLGNAAIPEVLGDFNGDGNLTKADVRYFADGLAIAVSGPHAGKLDRNAGFTAVDAAASGNFFATTLATAKPYAFGDSRGDVAASAAGSNAGGLTTGADGVISAKDIDYVWRQARGAIGNGTDGSFATLLTRANTDSKVDVRADLSADMNGDLKIDTADVTELVMTILGTQFGDANLDRNVDLADYDIWYKNVGSVTPGWAVGDFNGDGNIDLADYDSWYKHVGNYGTTVAAASAAAVPEPASLTLLGVGAALLMGRRRKA